MPQIHLNPRFGYARWLARFALFASTTVFANHAAVAASSKAMERTAKKACLAGDYAKGVAILADLYVATNDINYLYNQGRCFEQNGRYEDAIVRFREYQRKNKDAGRSPDPEAEAHINECQALLDRKAGNPSPAAPPPPTIPQVEKADPRGSMPAPQVYLVPMPAGPMAQGGGLTGPALPPPGASASMDVTSTPSLALEPSRSAYKTWWFWTGIVAVMAASATTAVLLTRKPASNVPQATLGSYGMF